jgi:histone acetyltransferase 1
MASEDELTQQQLEDQVAEWSSNSNECLNISVVRSDGSTHASFQPTFTYPIFGDEEVIFGYQDLEINLTFAAHNLRPHLEVQFSKEFPKLGDVQPTDIKEALQDFLPAGAFDKTPAEDANVAALKPPGDKIREYTREGQTYEIWCSSLTDDAAKEVLQNMQILIPMFIEGGSALVLDQDWTTRRWKLFLTYQVSNKPTKGTSRYAFVGFGTSYRVFTFPDRKNPDHHELKLLSSDGAAQAKANASSPDDFLASLQTNTVETPLDLPSRERLSQFFIVPTFQGGGHGQQLYNAMYTTLTAMPNVREFTVEDPNEAFDDLRDLCDLRHLRVTNPAFLCLKVNTDIPAEKLMPDAQIPTELIVSGPAEILRQTKIDPRQFGRLVEMQTLSRIPPNHRSRNRITKKERSTNEHDKQYYFWRLYAKHRLYVFNRDQLSQLDPDERPEKVESALDSVLEAYNSMLERAEAIEQVTETTSGASERANRKRKVIDDEDDDDDDDDDDDEDGHEDAHEDEHEGEEWEDEDEGEGLPTRKRARVG